MDHVSTKPPSLTVDGINKLLSEFYSLNELDQSSVKELDSWGDRNYYFKCQSKQEFVLKVIKQNDSSNADTVIQGLAEVMKFLSGHGYNCCWPIDSINGKPVLIFEESALVRLSHSVTFCNDDNTVSSPQYCVMVLNYVCGKIALNSPKTPKLFFEIGYYFGSMDKTLQVLTNKPIMERNYQNFDLKYLPHIRCYLPAVLNLEKRETFRKIIDAFELKVVPKIPVLSQGIIHNDGNMRNIIIADNELTTISGVIDFGDCVYSCHVFELGILIVEVLNDQLDMQAARHLLHGYIKGFPLPDMDLSLLYYVVLGRLAQVHVNGEHTYHLNPSNYIFKITQQVWILTEFLLGNSKDHFDSILIK